MLRSAGDDLMGYAMCVGCSHPFANHAENPKLADNEPTSWSCRTCTCVLTGDAPVRYVDNTGATPATPDLLDSVRKPLLALIDDLSDYDPVIEEAHMRYDGCFWCTGSMTWTGGRNIIEHEADCPWVRARRVLGKPIEPHTVAPTTAESREVRSIPAGSVEPSP